jgi:serine phosphatase RsbU (regulator of sigma subunit)
VAGRRVQGLGLTSKISLTVALLVIVVEAAMMLYVSTVLRSNLENHVKRNGAQAALILAEQARKDIARYLARDPQTQWQTESLESVTRFHRGGNRVPTGVEEAAILFGTTLIASTKPAEPPTTLGGQSEHIDGNDYDGIKCRRGNYRSARGVVPALQFGAEFEVPGQPHKGSAWIVISISKVDEYVSQLRYAALGGGAIFVLIGILVSYVLASGIVRPVRQLMRDMDIVSRGDFDHVTKRTSTDEVGLLALAFNDMTKSLKLAQELEQEQEQVQAELDTAREIQAHLLPVKIPQLPGFDIYQAYSPAKEVGGDYFDFIPVDRENLGIVVADVSGKGIPGSMVMSSARTVLRMLAAGNTSASDTLAQTNAIVARDIKRGMFVTAIYGILNVRQKTITVASAGHNPMVLYRARTGKVELVNPQGIALGFDKGPIFNRTIKEQTLQLYKGDRVVMYTDGVVESMNEKSEEFTDQRFYTWAQNNARGKSRDFVRALLRELDGHRGNAEPHDDITIVTVGVE